MKELHLPSALRRRILEHALSAPDEEVCGLIGGRLGRAASYHPVANDAEDRASRFLMDPQQQIDGMRRMRDAGETLLGIFHSHPRGPAAPSAVDLELAAYPGVAYLIASLDARELKLRAWFFDGHAFSEIALD